MAMATALLALLATGGVGALGWLQITELEAAAVAQQGATNQALAQWRREMEGAGSELTALRATVEQLAARQEATEAGRAAVEKLLQDNRRQQDDVTLLGVEQAVDLALQQLQLAANVPAARQALQLADQRLARQGRATDLALRRALARDIERLTALPLVDRAGISLRIETLMAGAAALPLADQARPPAPPVGGPPLPWWELSARELWQELKGLVRIQRFEGQGPLLLSPEQAFFLRENIKLRLLNARLALLGMEPAVYRSELGAVEALLARHFLGNDPQVRQARQEVQALAAIDFSANWPDFRESREAIAAARQRGAQP